MVAPRHYVYLGTLPLIALGAFVLAAVPINGRNDFVEDFCIGALLGTMFGQTTMAAAWTALGPAPLILRLPLSLLWVVLLLAALGLGSVVRSTPQQVVVLMAVSLATQWIVSQVPLWALALGFGLRLQHRDAAEGVHSQKQFGIGQLMIFTAIIAVLLGLGRVLVASGWFSLGQDQELLPVFLFLAGTVVVVTLPLVFAAFLSRYSLLAVMGTLVFIGLVTLGGAAAAFCCRRCCARSQYGAPLLDQHVHHSLGTGLRGGGAAQRLPIRRSGTEVSPMICEVSKDFSKSGHRLCGVMTSPSTLAGRTVEYCVRVSAGWTFARHSDRFPASVLIEYESANHGPRVSALRV